MFNPLSDAGVPVLDKPKPVVKTLLIGLGTGRCGTVSLARMLNQHPMFDITHEARPLLPWVPDEALFTTSIQCILSRPGSVVGDVSFFWLPYVSMLSAHVAKLKNVRLRFVAAERPIPEVVASFQRKVGPGINHWTTNSALTNPSHIFHSCFPKYDTDDRAAALSRYCSEYRSGLDQISNANRKVIKRVRTQDLVPGTIYEIFQWLGVPHVDVIPVKTNQTRPAAAGQAGGDAARHVNHGHVRTAPKLGKRTHERARRISEAAGHRMQHRRPT